MRGVSDMKKIFILSLCVCLMLTFVACSSPKIIKSYDTGEIGCYASPKAGECLFFDEVKAAREHYVGKNVQFLLKIDIFAKDNADLSDAELQTEYQRLRELGYELYEMQTWEYKDEGEKEYHDIVVGLFGEEQLAAFDINPKYGYAFYFAKNGDGSDISIQKN